MAFNSLESNLGKLLVLRALAFAWFPIPTIVLFYQSHGLNLEQAMMLKTILSLSILVLEVPSGYVADLLGRKFCLVAGSGVWIAGWLIYGWGSSFTEFAIAEILTGVAGSLISGANTALAFDSLLQLGKAQDYQIWEGRLVAIAGISEAICGIIGAAIAAVNLVYPFYLQTGCLIIYFCLALTLVEPQGHFELNRTQRVKQLKIIVIDVLVKRPQLRWLILLSATFSSASFLIVWLSQGYLAEINMGIAAFGWAWAVFHLLMSLASVNAHRIKAKLGIKKALFGLVLLLAISYICLGIIQQTWGIIFIATIYMVRGLVSPLILNSINQKIASGVRATVLSVNSFAFRIGFAIIAPIVGAIASGYSLALALSFAGCLFLVAGCFCWWQLVKLKAI